MRKSYNLTIDITIRAAHTSDLPEIYDLVVALAVYEKEPNSVQTTLEDYKRLFAQGLFEALVAAHDGKIIGMALYNMAFSTWKGKMLFLEDFIVQEPYRKTGIGQRLFDKLLEVAKAKGCTRLRWMVLDWNEPAIRFYEKNKAVLHKDWWIGDMAP